MGAQGGVYSPRQACLTCEPPRRAAASPEKAALHVHFFTPLERCGGSGFLPGLGPPGRFLVSSAQTKRPKSTQPFIPGSQGNSLTRVHLPPISCGHPHELMRFPLWAVVDATGLPPELTKVWKKSCHHIVTRQRMQQHSGIGSGRVRCSAHACVAPYKKTAPVAPSRKKTRNPLRFNLFSPNSYSGRTAGMPGTIQ